MALHVTIDERAIEQIAKLPRNVGRKVFRCIERLAEDSTPRGSEKLEGTRHLRKVRVGDHRIVYAVEKNEVFVLKVGDRKDVYRGLESLEKRLGRRLPPK